MKDSYSIRFFDGERQYAHILNTRVKRITNGVRASVAKLGDLGKITTDMDVLNGFLAIVLETDGIDFTDAIPEDTDAVVTDFFALFTAKTS